MSSEDCELDPRIQIELENLNTATDDINKLEIELEEASSTFHILLNESTRRLKLSSKKLGHCIEKARPYHEALEKAREAQIECQKAAVKFQRSNEIHAAAKETVALAEQRFMSNSHEWQFDNAWQEMLNHATQKVMDAEKQKAECHAEHQRRAKLFNAAEIKVQQLEERFRRSIAKSRPYFEEKQICQDQLQTQKNRIQELQVQVQAAKLKYAAALRTLESISDDIHRQRGDYDASLQISSAPPPGPREPGVGAELNSPITTTLPPFPDFQKELEKCDYPSVSFSGSHMSLDTTSMRSNNDAAMNRAAATGSVDDIEFDCNELVVDNNEGHNDDVFIVKTAAIDEDVETLRQKVKILAVRPIEGGDGEQQRSDVWEHELNATVNKLDQLMLLNERARIKQQVFKESKPKSQRQLKCETKNVRPDSLGAEDVSKNVDGEKTLVNNSSLPITPEHGIISSGSSSTTPLRKLQRQEPLPSVNVSMRELPLLARLSHEILDRASSYSRRRRRSLE